MTSRSSLSEKALINVSCVSLSKNENVSAAIPLGSILNAFTKYFGGIYFDTAEAANLAISTFRDELIWYFTEYKDSL